MSEDGRLTAAELSRGLKAGPASISTAVGHLTQQGLIRRERDPQRRRDPRCDHTAGIMPGILLFPPAARERRLALGQLHHHPDEPGVDPCGDQAVGTQRPRRSRSPQAGPLMAPPPSRST
ncbi:MarR family transcriptional regulator [Nonomuraea phyllanthi]|uniref:MarR family transcriptional regulator n=1 Tax=Nonomuraea phyllanthi TaxID=2219224 RepID=UPI001D007397|nr:MarR family transcriptional regulator [Nonomuraea phyllanthi]